MNAKTQKVLYSLLAIVIIAGILLAVCFLSTDDGTAVADDKPLVDYVAADHTLGENLVFGLQTAGVGMGIVFAVLIILWAAISLVSKIIGSDAEPKKAVTQAPVNAAPVAVSADDETELVAVCTAAIAAARGESDCAFNIISITEIQ